MDVKKVRAAAARPGNFACAAVAGARLWPHTRPHPRRADVEAQGSGGRRRGARHARALRRVRRGAAAALAPPARDRRGRRAARGARPGAHPHRAALRNRGRLRRAAAHEPRGARHPRLARGRAGLPARQEPRHGAGAPAGHVGEARRCARRVAALHLHVGGREGRHHQRLPQRERRRHRRRGRQQQDGLAHGQAHGGAQGRDEQRPHRALLHERQRRRARRLRHPLRAQGRARADHDHAAGHCALRDERVAHGAGRRAQARR